MRLGRSDKLEDFEGIRVLCAGGCDAEVVAKGELDLAGFEAEISVDLDTEHVV